MLYVYSIIYLFVCVFVCVCVCMCLFVCVCVIFTVKDLLDAILLSCLIALYCYDIITTYFVVSLVGFYFLAGR